MTQFVVLVKQVPEPGSVSMDPETGHLIRDSAPAMLNPYCEHALELGIGLMAEGDELTAICMGPPSASDALRRCLELGATRAVLLVDRALAGSDARATSIALAAAIRTLVPDVDLVLTGKQAIDGDTAQVPGMLAEMIGFPVVYDVTEASCEGSHIEAVRCSDRFKDRIRVPLPSLISVSRGSLIRRLPSIPDFLRAMGSNIDSLAIADIGLVEDVVGSKGSATRVTRMSSPVIRGQGRIVRDADEGAGIMIDHRILNGVDEDG